MRVRLVELFLYIAAMFLAGFAFSGWWRSKPSEEDK